MDLLYQRSSSSSGGRRISSPLEDERKPPGCAPSAHSLDCMHGIPSEWMRFLLMPSALPPIKLKVARRKRQQNKYILGIPKMVLWSTLCALKLINWIINQTFHLKARRLRGPNQLTTKNK